MKALRVWSAVGFAMLVLLAALGGCAARAGSPEENLLYRQTESDSGKLTITLSCDARIDHFAAAVETRFPDVRLIQDCYLGDYRVNEHIARVEHGDLGDLAMVKAGYLSSRDLSDQLMDLSTQPFPARFNASSMPMDEEGRIYLIPGPLSFNCNIYNKTLFEEKGWTVPETYEQFLDLCRTVEESGIRGCQYVYHDSSKQSNQLYNFSVCSTLDILTQVEGQTWYAKLSAGEQVSLAPMETAFQDLQRQMAAGIVRKEDLLTTENMRNAALASRKIAISAGEIDTLRALSERGGDEFRFMPHYSMTEGQGWLLSQGYYFGANEALLEPGNEKKLEAALEILGFIASEEGQKLLMEDGLGMVPATMGAETPDDPLLRDILNLVESGRYLMPPGYEMFASVLGTEIGAFIREETTSGAILDQCRALLESGASPDPVLGQASADFTVLQTGLLKADALRAAAQTDAALIGMAEGDGYAPVGGTRSKLYAGAITEADVTRINRIRADAPIPCCRASLTGKALLTLLEYGATSEEEQAAGEVSHFHPFAVSGLTVSYDLDADLGKRVLSARWESGEEVDPEKTYTVSYLKDTVPMGRFITSEVLGRSMTDCFLSYLEARETVSPDADRVRLQD